MRILIAEDDLTSRMVLAAVLKKGGHQVTATANGAEAWTEMQKLGAPQLAILDWMMPEMDGLEVVRRIRSLQTDQPPYIIMLTTKGGKADIITGLEAGANDYVTKPFDSGELRARIDVGKRMVEMQEALFKSREELAHQATHDPLTGLLNRRAILQRLHQELSRAARNGDLLAIGICDLDHFKHINDTYGHQTGDEILCRVTEILKGTLREYDCIGRIGGEEFLVIGSMQRKTDCKPLFDRMCAMLSENKIMTRSGKLSVTVSIGVALVTAGSSVDEILTMADAALYRSKDAGRNRITYDELSFLERNDSPQSD